MRSPIISTLVAFTKLCVEQEEHPFFKNDRVQIHGFFYRMCQKHPTQFREMNFLNKRHRHSQEIQIIFGNLMMCEDLSLSRNGVYETKKKILRLYEGIDKETFGEIAQGFYDKLSCDMSGRIGRHDKLSSVETLAS